MLAILGFLLGIVFTVLLFNGKINIKIHHVYEDVSKATALTDADLDNAYKKMNEQDPELDKLYETMGAIQDIMEGSDRIDVKE